MAGAAPKRPLRPSYVFHVRLTLLQQQKVRPYFVNCSTNWIVFSASLTQGPRRPNETSLLRPCAIVFRCPTSEPIDSLTRPPLSSKSVSNWVAHAASNVSSRDRIASALGFCMYQIGRTHVRTPVTNAHIV